MCSASRGGEKKSTSENDSVWTGACIEMGHGKPCQRIRNACEALKLPGICTHVLLLQRFQCYALLTASARLLGPVGGRDLICKKWEQSKIGKTNHQSNKNNNKGALERERERDRCKEKQERANASPRI